MELEPDFSEFCASLNEHRVEYVIVSAYALAFHGAPRYTGDLDILVCPTEENGRRLLSAISSFGFPTTTLTPRDIVIGRKVIEMGIPPVQLHVMSAIDGVTWGEVWDGREESQLGALTISFIGRAEFLRNKKAAGRVKDLADIEALRAIESSRH